MPNYQGPGVYRHYKGGAYQVLGLALREETLLKEGEPDVTTVYDAGTDHKTHEGVTVVVYRPLTPGSLLEDRPEAMWTRDLDDFNDERVEVRVEAGLADGPITAGTTEPAWVPRFEKVDPATETWRPGRDGVPDMEVPTPTARFHRDGPMVVIDTVPGARIERSDFPHPLVTVDYGLTAAGEETVVGFTLVGPPALRVVEAIADA